MSNQFPQVPLNTPVMSTNVQGQFNLGWQNWFAAIGQALQAAGFGNNSIGQKSVGQYTGQINGGHLPVQGTVFYTIVGNVAFQFITSNISTTVGTSSMTLSGQPSILIPAHATGGLCLGVQDPGHAGQVIGCFLTGNVFISFGTAQVSGAFLENHIGNMSIAGANPFGLAAGWMISYPLI